MKSGKDEQYVSLAREIPEEDGWQPRVKATLRDPWVLVFASSVVDWIGAYFRYNRNQPFCSAAVIKLAAIYILVATGVSLSLGRRDWGRSSEIFCTISIVLASTSYLCPSQ
jgi:hypothetical protein